jgi:predicted DCC family thiol-disulfide oxidoreductase YuxK
VGFGGRPTLLYDGACGFCRRWIERWREITGDRVTYAAWREAGHYFPQVDPAVYLKSVVFIDASGNVFLGAEAVFRALATTPGWSVWLWLYERVPLFRRVSDRVYTEVSRHRLRFSRVTQLLWGRDLRLPRYHLVRWVFLRGLGVVYVIAFVSLWTQLHALVGAGGIEPAEPWLAAVRDRFGRAAYLQAPTLFWLGASDFALHVASAAGLAAGLFLVVNRLPHVAALLAWLLYLSLFTVGSVFLSFQWDILLLEAGFLAILLAPRRFAPKLGSEPRVPRTVVFLLRWLLFRLMLLSGLVKLASGDPGWWDLTALTFHYETQPLPTTLSWYVHNLPESVHRISCFVMFVVEIALPFFMFAPRRLRVLAFSGTVALQLAIMATGNYTFFNLLTCVLSVSLLDDAFLARVMPLRFARAVDLRAVGNAPPGMRRAAMSSVIVAVLVTLTLVHAWGRLYGYGGLPYSVRRTVAATNPFHLANSYGLFAVMTKQRREITIEGSDDATTWKAYEFRWKPGDPARAPRFCQPHQPRLDWQMWFAALSSYRSNPWLLRFMQRLLEGSPSATGLLAHNPFPERPPRYVRAMIEDYRFTTITGRRAEGLWWDRDNPRPYAPVMTSVAD